MLERFWPPFGVTVRTPRLDIRLPRDDDLPEVLAVVDGGIHDPATMPFLFPWTDTPSPQRERTSLQFWWRSRAEWTPNSWVFNGAVFVEGRFVGMQDMRATNFSALRTVSTGSWLGREHQGRGLGKEMRAAILHLAFAGLGAVEARSGAWTDNTVSRRVSRSLGYREQEGALELRRGQPDRLVEFVLDRDSWAARRRDDIEIIGLEPALELFGVSTPGPGHS
ncbi:MAG TPA: GNAT family N-acetyltransferase [Acidimicrobiales bacterium]|nr:GNAT family N-acetyltransferase [Acidimicrobiales bacterium]